MKEMELHIKNMVCPRCIMVVSQELQQLGTTVEEIKLGYARIAASETLSYDMIGERLARSGFELLREPDAVLAEEVKVAVMAYLEQLKMNKAAQNLSDYLTHTIGKNYHAISTAFSRYEGKTIEKYFIALRIEQAKELLQYDELTLGQIAQKLGYSNVHYLSNQFKKTTGMSVTAYKQLLKQPQSGSPRKHLDDL